MRKPLLLAFLFLFSSHLMNAQPPGFDLLPVALSCNATFPLCDVDSTYNATDGVMNANVPPNFCGVGSVGNNAQWIQFYAGTSSITFHFDVSNCTVSGQGEGLQIAPWASDDCTDYTLLGPCQNSGGQNTPTYDVVANGMIPGFCYFLLIDGWDGSQCDYEMTVTNGSTVPPPIVIGPITPSFVGQLTTGCAIAFEVAPQGDCVTTDWTTSGGVMNEGQYTTNITFDNPGSYTICFDAQYENTACQPAVQECTTVNVIEAPHTPRMEVLCPGEELMIGNQTFNSTTFTEVTIQDQNGCDSIIDLDLTVLGFNELTENIDSTICKGDTVFFGGVAFFTQGNPHQLTLPSTTMSTLTGQFCDSLIRLNLSILDPRSMIDPTAGIPCSGDSITLTGVPGFAGVGQFQTVQWYFENDIIPGATNNTINVVDEGNYIFEVTILKGAIECTATDTVFVEMSIGGVDAFAGPDTVITCLVPEIQLNGSTTATGNLQYEWTTDTGFISSGATSLTPIISADGCYFLEVFDVAENCSGFDTLCVTQDAGIPTVMVSPVDLVLSCATPAVTISGNGSSTGTNITYTWSGPGVVPGTENDPTITVSEGGLYTLDLFDTSNGCPASSGVTVTMDTLSPIVEAGADTVLSCATPLVPLSPIGSEPYGGIYTYTWSGPGINATNINEQFPFVDSDGTYTLTILNTENGCENTDNVDVTLSLDFPIASAGDGLELNCTNNVMVQLDGAASNSGAGYPLIWTGPGINTSNESQVSPNVTEAGWYYINVENGANGCIAIDSVLVTIDTIAPIADIVMPDVIQCDPTEITLDASGSSPMTDINYQWSGPDITINNEGSPTPMISQDGDYSLTVTNTSNGCEDMANVTVMIDTVTAIPTAIGDTLACGDLNVTLMGGSNLADVTYFWVGPANDTIHAINPVVNSVGVYTLHAINNANNCISTTTAEVTPDTNAPNINLDGGDLDCDNLMTNIIVTSDSIPVIYTWTIGGVDVNGSMQTVSDPGIYPVTVTNTDNGCEVDGQVVVMQDIVEPDVSVAADSEFDCENTEVDLMANATNGSGNYTYTWTTANGEFISPANISSPTIGMAGTYNVVVEDVENGCTTNEEITVDQNTTTPEGDITASSINCFSDANGTIEFTNITGGVGPYTYSIDNGQTFTPTPSFFLLDPGQYYVAIKDDFGCITYDSIEVVQPEELLIDLGPDFTLNLGDSTNLFLDINNPQLVDSIFWSPSLDSCFTPDCTSMTIGPFDPTIYTVTVFDVNGCSVSDQVQVNINKERNVFLPTAFYPGSTIGNNTFMVYGELGQITKVDRMMVYDRWGENLFENKDFLPNDPNEGWNGTYDNKLLNSGVFMYVIELTYIDGNTEVFKGDVTIIR